MEAEDKFNQSRLRTMFFAKCSEAEKPKDSPKFGFDLYPERRGEKVKFSYTEIAFGDGRAPIDKMRCERNVYKCVMKSKFD